MKKFLLSFIGVLFLMSPAFAANAILARIVSLQDMQQFGCQITIGVTNTWKDALTRGVLDVDFLDRNGNQISSATAVLNRLSRIDIEETKTLPANFGCWELKAVRLSWSGLSSINGNAPSQPVLDALTGITFVRADNDVNVLGASTPTQSIKLEMPGCANCSK